MAGNVSEDIMKAFAQDLMQQMQSRLQKMSDTINTKIAGMETKFNELEQNIFGPPAEMEVERTPSPSPASESGVEPDTPIEDTPMETHLAPTEDEIEDLG